MLVKVRVESLSEVMVVFPDPVLQLFPGGHHVEQVGGAGQAALYYDLSWNGCDKANASYVMTLSWDRKDHMETLSLTVADTDGTDALYSLSARHHVPYTLNDREAAP